MNEIPKIDTANARPAKASIPPNGRPASISRPATGSSISTA